MGQHKGKEGGDMTLTDAIASRLYALCDERNISLNRLCAMCGITQSTLNNIVNTGSRNPTVTTLKRVCDGCGITLAEFFDDPVFREVDRDSR